MNRNLMKQVIIKTIPVMTGYLVLGLGFGILSENAGYGIGWVLTMSVFIYAGSMQYLMVSLLTSGASVISTALATLMVNARHLFYGISMIGRYKAAGKKKPYLIFALTDETYSLVCGDDTPPGVDPHLYYFLVSLCNQIYWITGTVLGAVIGSAITFNTAGIDFAMTALFVTVFVEQWLTAKNHIPAVAGVAITVVCLIIFGSDLFLIPSMIMILAGLMLGRRRLDCPDRPAGENEAAAVEESVAVGSGKDAAVAESGAAGSDKVAAEAVAVVEMKAAGKEAQP